MSERRNAFVELFLARRFTAMLLALMGLMLLRITDSELQAETPLPDLAGGVLLVVAGLAMCEQRRMRALAVGLGLPTLVLISLAAFQIRDDSRWLQTAARSASALYMALVTSAILQGLLRRTQVNSDTLIGAFCGYLLIAALFAELYCALLTLNPGSISNSGVVTDGSPDGRWQISVYFSLSTLTTVGYGDFTPSDPATRMLAMCEAVVGQFYMAILVAGLVGIYASQRLESK